MNSKNIEDHIQTFYQRNNLVIPEAERKLYFDKEGDLIIDKEQDKLSQKYDLFKGFLATNKIKDGTGERIMQVVPDESDPRNLRFVEGEQIKSKHGDNLMQNIDDLLQNQKMKGNLNTQYVEYFNRDDLLRSQSQHSKAEDYEYDDNERERLLDQGYKFASDIAYPEIVDLDHLKLNYNPASPVPNTKDDKDNEEDMKTKDYEDTLREPPSKQNFVVHKVGPNDTIEKVCIMYGVSKDIIRMANDFLGEEIYMFKELKIPYTYGRIYEPQKEKESDEETK